MDNFQSEENKERRKLEEIHQNLNEMESKLEKLNMYILNYKKNFKI